MISLRKISIFLFVALLALGVFPLGSLAAETGTITISVQNEDGDAFSGNWYLYRGSTANGFLVRNGNSGETFQIDTGFYFLEVRGVPNDHPYYLLHSENPRLLEEGGTILFSVQYFTTEEEKLIASGNLPAPETIASVQEPDIFDVHGCNSTQGFVWCARSETCVRYWTPACKVDVVEEAEETGEETEEPVVASEPVTPAPTPIAPVQQVPTFETAPATFEPVIENNEEIFVLPFQLAQTGPLAGLLLIPSMLIGLALTRKRS